MIDREASHYRRSREVENRERERERERDDRDDRGAEFKYRNVEKKID